MKEISVHLGKRSYPIYIGAGIISHGTLFKKHITGKQVLLVSNETVAKMYLERVAAHYADAVLHQIILPDGEQYKTLAYLEQIITALLEHKFNRDCCIIAVGGGVVGDTAGFAAACYQRGVAFIQIPTTLLAQVDSSVGGKTAVNHMLGKNMIGAFHQPAAVIADVTVLESLPDRELSAGIAEVIKYGLIHDTCFLDWLDQHIESLLRRDQDALIHAIERSCATKATIVANDENELGQRAILNLGHTFGHAVETLMEYKGWLHGEAVACGMLMAVALSQQLGWLNSTDVERVRQLLTRAKLPTRLPNAITTQSMLERMKVDKKAKDGKIVLVLLKKIGQPVVTTDYHLSMLSKIIDRFSANTSA